MKERPSNLCVSHSSSANIEQQKQSDETWPWPPSPSFGHGPQGSQRVPHHWRTPSPGTEWSRSLSPGTA